MQLHAVQVVCNLWATGVMICASLCVQNPNQNYIGDVIGKLDFYPDEGKKLKGIGPVFLVSAAIQKEVDFMYKTVTLDLFQFLIQNLNESAHFYAYTTTKEQLLNLSSTPFSFTLFNIRCGILISKGLDLYVVGLSPWWLTAAAHPWVEEEVDVLVQEGLVLLVSSTEVLQKLVGQLHDVLHAQVFPLKKECGGLMHAATF